MVDMGDDAEVTDMFHTLAFPVPAKVNPPKEDLPQPIKYRLSFFKPQPPAKPYINRKTHYRDHNKLRKGKEETLIVCTKGDHHHTQIGGQTSWHCSNDHLVDAVDEAAVK